MINWETLAAMSVTLTALGAFFLFVVKSLVQGYIRDAINGFSTKIALVSQRLDASEKKFDELYRYTHGTYHDTLNKITDAQLEAFRAGRAIQRDRG